jgi:hypothetical protein
VLPDGSKSREAPVQAGVQQGSVLGPLLFLVFKNDLPNYMYVSPESTTRMFADDCALYTAPSTQTKMLKPYSKT